MDRQQLLAKAVHHAEAASQLANDARPNGRWESVQRLASTHTALAAAWAQIAALHPTNESGDPR